MTRISTLAQHQLTQSQIFQTQKRLQDLQVQLSSGEKAQRYSGLAQDTSRLINLESALMRTNQYVKSNDTISLRLQTMELSIAETFDIASELKTMLVNASSGQNASELPIVQSAANMMDELSRILNVKLGDHYLFSGAATSTPPVDFTDPDFTAPPTVYPSSADTSYYQGDSTRLSARVADDYDVTWGVTANESGFEKLTRALHLTATVTTTPSVDMDRLQEALTLVNEAVEEIPVIRARVGGAMKSIEQTNESHADVGLYVGQHIADIRAVDVPLATTQLANDQLILEASYMTVSRLSQLTLATYLR